MNVTIDELTFCAVAAPENTGRRYVLADMIAEHGDQAVSDAVRDDRRGPRVLAATWQHAREQGAEPAYRFLWAVVTFNLDATPKAPAVPRAPRRRREEPTPTIPVLPPAPVDDTPPRVPPFRPGRPFTPWRPGRPWVDGRGDRPRIVPLRPSDFEPYLSDVRRAVNLGDAVAEMHRRARASRDVTFFIPAPVIGDR